ncbi:hypothetical protein B932_1737 [Gluconobacter oxydans H24]|nr:hypothetical protein B932_1737 [Gluconobacter oxydans H24]
MVFTKGSLTWDEQSREITHSLDPASLTREVESMEQYNEIMGAMRNSPNLVDLG